MAFATSQLEKLDLLSNASATGSYVTCKGGRYIWAIEGTFNGGSYQLQAKNANGTATDIAGATMSAAGFMLLDVAVNAEIRAVETGTTSAMYSTLTAVV